jgi:hypothetical protein
MLNLDKETLNFLEVQISIMLRSCKKNFGIFLYHGMGVHAGWVNELLKEGYYISAEMKQKAGSCREFTNYLKTE